MKHLIAAPLIALTLSGCAGFAFTGQRTAFGPVYTSAVTPNFDVPGNEVGKKRGEACATSILGWFTTGNASVRMAADDGGIKHISSVDSKFTNILGIWSEYCTVVSGTGN